MIGLNFGNLKGDFYNPILNQLKSRPYPWYLDTRGRPQLMPTIDHYIGSIYSKHAAFCMFLFKFYDTITFEKIFYTF